MCEDEIIWQQNNWQIFCHAIEPSSFRREKQELITHAYIQNLLRGAFYRYMYVIKVSQSVLYIHVPGTILTLSPGCLILLTESEWCRIETQQSMYMYKCMYGSVTKGNNGLFVLFLR